MQTIVSQQVTESVTRAAVFLVLTLRPGSNTAATCRALSGDLAGIVRAIGSRLPDTKLSCVMGFGADAWKSICGTHAPKGLHPFKELKGKHHAVSTQADLLFHIRAARMDVCFELATHLMDRLGDVVASADQVQGFSYFDNRDLIGFVDGTENPVDGAAREATIIGDEDPDFAGGSYVIIQKYLHDLKTWNALPVAEQEKIIGRYKQSNIELADDVKPSYAHNALTTILDEDGKQLDILRDNMPFGDPAKGEFGTYFIGYARSPERIERMLENMFIGSPPGNYDRLLDFSRAITGSLFFTPSADFLDSVPDMKADDSSATKD